MVTSSTHSDVTPAPENGYAVEGMWKLVAEHTRDHYTLVGELSRTRDERRFVYVARSKAEGEHLVLLTADQKEGDEVDLLVKTTLDASILAERIPCPHCAAILKDWGPVCGACGASVMIGTAVTEDAAEEALASARQHVSDTIEVAGYLRSGPDGIVFVIRDRVSGAAGLARYETESGGRGAQLVGICRLRQPQLDAPARAVSSSGSPHSGELGPLDPTEQPLLEQRRRISRQTAVASTAPAHKFCPQCEQLYEGEIKFCPSDGTALRPAGARVDLVGHIVGDRYHVLRLLGEGGMGRVYLAEHIKMGRRCALKVLSPRLVDSPDAVRRFGREARNASRISHPNVATVYDFEETRDGVVYLAMEFVDGQSLARHLGEHGRFDVPRAMRIGRDVASALYAAHVLGIVHRDLKPDNIMLATGEDGREVVKVVDFGIAKAIQDSEQKVTQTGFVLGTPDYMSPEQLAGENTDGRTDVYSLGCVLYEMLVGRPVFASEGREALLRRRMSEEPPHPRSARSDVPTALDTIVVSALARAPGDRFATADALREALDAALAQPVPPPRPQFPSIQVGAVAVVILAAGIAVTMRLRQPTPMRQASVPPTVALPAITVTGIAVPPTPAAPGTASEQQRRSASAGRPGDPSSDQFFDYEKERRLGQYYAALDNPDYAAVFARFRAAGTALSALEREYPTSSAIRSKRDSLSAVVAHLRTECMSVAEVNRSRGAPAPACQ